jgi:hypothetical protein
MSKFGGFGSSGSAGGQVILNVYDLNDNNAILYPWGFGMFHSGVQIGREEYTFGKLDLVSLLFSFSYNDCLQLLLQESFHTNQKQLQEPSFVSLLIWESIKGLQRI